MNTNEINLMKNDLLRIYGNKITIMNNHSPSNSVPINLTRISKTEDMENEVSSVQSWRHVNHSELFVKR